MSNILEFLSSHRTFFTYCIIGLCGVACDLLVYSLLLRSAITEYQTANAIRYLAGTVLSFMLNARFNFRVRDRLMVRFMIFLGVAMVGYAASAGMLHLLVEAARFGRYLAKGLTLIAVVPIQYNLNRRLSFGTGS